MTHRLATNYAKNHCNRTLTVKVIVENVVTCFLGHSVGTEQCKGRSLNMWNTGSGTILRHLSSDPKTQRIIYAKHVLFKLCMAHFFAQHSVELRENQLEIKVTIQDALLINKKSVLSAFVVSVFDTSIKLNWSVNVA